MQEKAVFKEFIPSDGRIRKAAEKAEQKSHICERAVKDILDETADCFCDDLVFRKRMFSEIFFRPKMKRKIAFKFISIIIQQ